MHIGDTSEPLPTQHVDNPPGRFRGRVRFIERNISEAEDEMLSTLLEHERAQTDSFHRPAVDPLTIRKGLAIACLALTLYSHTAGKIACCLGAL